MAAARLAVHQTVLRMKVEHRDQLVQQSLDQAAPLEAKTMDKSGKAEDLNQAKAEERTIALNEKVVAAREEIREGKMESVQE